MRGALTAAWSVVQEPRKVSQKLAFLSVCLEGAGCTFPSSCLLENELAEDKAGWQNRKTLARF